MKSSNSLAERSCLAWWYVDTFDYREIMNSEQERLIAMEKDGALINDIVQIKVDQQTAIAKLGTREFWLLPNNWITPRVETLNGFWIAKDLDFTDPEVEDIYRIIEAGSIWKSADRSVKLFGRRGNNDIANRGITTIIPIGKKGHYIASDGLHASLVSTRERNETKIRIAMQRMTVAK